MLFYSNWYSSPYFARGLHKNKIFKVSFNGINSFGAALIIILKIVIIVTKVQTKVSQKYSFL